jgi:hypothetical protein
VDRPAWKLDRESEHLEAGIEINVGTERGRIRVEVDRLAVEHEGEAAGGRGASAKHHASGDRVLVAGPLGDDEVLDTHDCGTIILDAHDIDRDSRGEELLGCTGEHTIGLVAVGDQQDPSGGIRGDQGEGEIDALSEVAGVDRSHAAQLGARYGAAWEQLDERIPCDGDETEAITITTVRERGVQKIGGKLLLASGHGVADVEHGNDGNIVGSPPGVRAGECHRE